MSNAALIVAAGRGTRAGGDVPKQWQPLAGRRVLDVTLNIFAAHPAISLTCLVLHPADMALAPDLPGVIVTQGGEDRAASVRSGLAALAHHTPQTVLIHDVARPCLPPALIDAVLRALDAAPGAAPALTVTDALWTGAEGRVTGTQNRSGLYRAQTPQGFHFDAIRAAHAAHPGGAADDVEVARWHGLDVAIVPGDEDNIKITLPGDLTRAARILERR
ncbi:MAG: 2-C-methyl-D-erythritol 4-phosphate cytidylyltransferase [Pseudomonadota bacterium]